jgi:hypothetical protein
MLLMRLAAPSKVERGTVFKRRARGGWLPVGREQDGEVVPIGHGRESFQDVV